MRLLAILLLAAFAARAEEPLRPAASLQELLLRYGNHLYDGTLAIERERTLPDERIEEISATMKDLKPPSKEAPGGCLFADKTAHIRIDQPLGGGMYRRVHHIFRLDENERVIKVERLTGAGKRVKMGFDLGDGKFKTELLPVDSPDAVEVWNDLLPRLLRLRRSRPPAPERESCRKSDTPI